MLKKIPLPILNNTITLQLGNYYFLVENKQHWVALEKNHLDR